MSKNAFQFSMNKSKKKKWNTTSTLFQMDTTTTSTIPGSKHPRDESSSLLIPNKKGMKKRRQIDTVMEELAFR